MKNKLKLKQRIIRNWYVLLILTLIILVGAYFRFVGINWDENFHLHPDERFLTMVETAINPVGNFRDYFNTSTSLLNPHNVVDINGNQTFPFFVYGTFPIFLVRYIGEFLGRTGYSEIHLVGRYLSGIFDLGTIILIFFITKDLFRSKKIALISSFFYACAILPIQISHYFIVDNFTTFFCMLAFFAAIRIMRFEGVHNNEEKIIANRKGIFAEQGGIKYYLLFAFALGLAAASKINAAAAAFLLPVAIIFSSKNNYFKSSNIRWKTHFIYTVFTAVISLIVFRIFQPYAFSGPGFLNFSLNPKWINNIKELSALSSGLSSYPPSLQWTRRAFMFPIQNMLVWGMGIPFGVTSIIGLFVMGWAMVKGNWKKFGILIAWTIIYLVWQALRWNPTMRYFLLIYPTFAVIAGWFVGYIFNKRIQKKHRIIPNRSILNGVLFASIIFLLAVWAYAFTDIYRQPMTRIEASEWIYKHIEGPINLQFANGSEKFSQPIPYPKYYELFPDQTLSFEYHPVFDLDINKISFDHIKVQDPSSDTQQFALKIITKNSQELLAEMNVMDSFKPSGDARGQSYVFNLPTSIALKKGEEYVFSIRSLQTNDILQFSGTICVIYQFSENEIQKSIFEFAQPLIHGEPYLFSFSPIDGGSLSAINLFRVLSIDPDNQDISLSVTIRDSVEKKIIGTGELSEQISQTGDFRGQNISILLDKPIKLNKGTSYELILAVDENSTSSLFLYGSKTAKETDWDDALPLFMYGFNPFDSFSGVYQSDLNFQMYWDDNAEKFSRFTSILDKADYIIFSSNRQWGSVTQAPEKYPLSTLFYKELIGCKLDDVQKCYIQAESEMVAGNLGFNLTKVFKSEPHILGLKINSQNAEEAFTVYDHPKVLIFKKTDEFSSEKMVTTLSKVDLDTVLNVSPQEIEKMPGLLLLPESILNNIKNSGTWSELFNYESLQNKHPFLTVVIWYLSITILGWMAYPSVRVVFQGSKDKGWAVTRLVGLIILTYFVWMIGSFGIEVGRGTIILCAVFLFVLNGFLFYSNKEEIIEELGKNKKTILAIEGFSLLFFIFFLLIRIGNPDLWHPYKGGEKPMDFAYFNAVIRSTTFPPYDPWYSGGYINYYYWGFLLAAVPTKGLGIVPSNAYNLLLPTFFSFTAISAYGIGINFPKKEDTDHKKNFAREIKSGLIAAIFLLLIGNLGTVKMIFQGFQRLAYMANPISSGGVFDGIKSLIEGIKLFLIQGKFNYYPGDWYWIPSRTIPGEPITEFPFFTFLYGDPHAHLFALPITLLALAWTLSLLEERLRYKNKWEFAVKIIFGGIIVGALRPTNTWDYPVSLTIACGSLLFVFIKYVKKTSKILPNLADKKKRILFGVISSIAFALLSYYLFCPFTKWYGQGYSSIEIWKGDRTSIGSYLTHWGFFFFVIYSWLISEMINWMKETPLSELKKYYSFRKLIFALFALFMTILIGAMLIGIEVSIIIIPILVTFSLLLFRKKYSDKEKFIILLTCIGLGLTLIVELIVLSGDIGRMNTVFKFYLQAWTCLGLSSSWYIYQLVDTTHKWEKRKFLSGWRTLLSLLLISVMLFPVFASADKITDRISSEVPLTLDGMEYMSYSSYTENSQSMNLRQDYDLIRWMQDNIMGTPTIIEANVPEYRWGNRISIYTGLPTVIGWNWHQRQQRVINPPEWVFNRVQDVEMFYSGTDLASSLEVIKKYNIDYVVIGQLERIIYPHEGIEKFFQEKDGVFEICYSTEDTFLLKVKR